jgi:dihydroorotate dehydrogenase electron transfer subunit
MDEFTAQCSMPGPYENCVGLNLSAVHVSAEVGEQQQLAEGTYRMRLAAPQIARQITPGQFFMVRDPSQTDPLLGRPFALYDVARDADGKPTAIDFAYHVVGKFTAQMSRWTGGERVDVWGPLGNGFPSIDEAAAVADLGDAKPNLICVGGGIGYTPFLAMAREAVGQRTYGKRRPMRTCRSVKLLYGSRNAKQVADLSDFNDISDLSIEIATDDGSRGHHGFVTDLLIESLKSTSHPIVYCCGPEPMMQVVAKICEERNVACWVSLESPMACGFGVCFSCVVKVKTDDTNGWDYRRTCVEGPVFAASSLVWTF